MDENIPELGHTGSPHSALEYKGYTFQQKLTRFVIGFVGFFMLIGLLAGGILVLSRRAAQQPTRPVEKNQSSSVSPIPSPLPTVTTPSGWSIFTNATHIYSIPFPPEYTVSCGSQYSCRFTKTPDSPSFVYISVVPQEMKDSTGRIDNYDAGEIRVLSSLKIGESKVIRQNTENSELNQYYIFTRLPDETIGSKTAAVFENKKPQDKPVGATERRYIILNNGTVFIFGGYLTKDGVTLTTLRQMLSGIEFL